MKQSIAKQWIKVLRSGEIKQGVGCLDYSGRMCCLGVLCNIAILEGVWDVEKSFGSKYSFDGVAGFLPISVMEWAGIESYDGELPDGKSLAIHNDNGKTFNQIANLIDKHWKTL